MRSRLPTRYWIAILVPFLLLGIGTVGYRHIEGPPWTYFDALYMTSITLTTIGYGETHPLSNAGRVFTIFLAYGGIFVLFFTASAIIHSVVSGELKDTFGKARMKNTLDRLQDHIIVCGLGRMGKLICQDLDQQDVPFVVIEQELKTIKLYDLKHGIPIPGDATSDDILKLAGVERARALITVLPNDSTNLYITLSARTLNPRMQIVARAEEETAIPKLKRVGANDVIAPYVLGGHYLAKSVLKPHVGEYLQGLTRAASRFVMEQLHVSEKSDLGGKTLRALRLHDDLGILVLTIRNPDGELFHNPQGDMVVKPGSALVVVGERERLDELEKRAAGTVEPSTFSDRK